MNSALHDFRFALRQMQKSPGFALIAILTLSLGVGAATAIFSVVDAVVLRPLPYEQPDRIYIPQTIAREGYTQPFSWLSYLDARAQSHSFAAFSGIWEFHSVNLETPSGPVALQSVEGSDDFFDVFGVAPLLGRTFRAGEDQAGKNDVAVLSFEVWKTNFGGNEHVIGQAIKLDGKPYTCIGVMPSGFRYPLSSTRAVYTPLHPNPAWINSRGTHWLRVIGRLKPGVTPSRAQAELNNVMANLGRAYPDTDAGRRVHLIGLAQSLLGSTSAVLWALSAAVLAVLLIGCVNVAGLLLARGVKRAREMALRAAIGAGRNRLIRQMLTESLMLATFGAAGGAVLSWLLLATMRSFVDHAMARGTDIRINVPVLIAALIISVVASFAASLYPALHLSGADPSRSLRSGGGAGTARTHHRLRSAFIVCQVALSLVLLVVAGVLLRAVTGFRHTDPGFDVRHIMATPIDLSPARYKGHDIWGSVYQPLLERVHHLPEVEGAGLIDIVPVQAWGSNSEIHLTGQPPYPPNEASLAEQRFVSADYFDAMGIHLLQGRSLSPSIDVAANKSAAMVVNQAFVKKFVPGNLDPVGQHIDDRDKTEEKTSIVGVVSSVRQNLMESSLPEMDLLMSSVPADYAETVLLSTNLVLRTSGDPRRIVSSLRTILHDIDPTLPFRTPKTMEEIIGDQLVMQRMESWLFGIFASLAVLLAVTGIYGLISQEIEMGTRETGIRMALGASRIRVFAMGIRRIAVLLAFGITAGLVLTFAAQRMISSVVLLRFAHEAGLLVLLAFALTAAGLVAALIPLRRMASIEPVEALRAE
jgi:putative ABC transport system permease protein